jgi:hypothetical protein
MGDLDAARGSIAVLAPDQPVLHGGRRATFLHMSRGAAIIRYWGDSHAVSVSPEALSLTRARTASNRPPLAASDEPMLRELTHRQRLRLFDLEQAEQRRSFPADPAPAACGTPRSRARPSARLRENPERSTGRR